jgi:hypothetical protein
MSYEIIESGPTASGRWQVRVVIDETQSQFFKFDAEPTQAQVDRQAEIFVLSQQLSALQNSPLPDTSAEAPSRILTQTQYMNRFTQAELEAIYAAEAVSVAVRVWIKRFEAAPTIDLDTANTIAGLQAMEAAGLIGAGRANEILA